MLQLANTLNNFGLDTTKVFPHFRLTLKSSRKWARTDDVNFLIISKNACSTIVYAVVQWLAINTKVDPIKDSNADHFHTLATYQNNSYTPGKPIVAFYRDPVERFLSFVNFTFVNPDYKEVIGVMEIEGMENTINHLINYASVINAFNNVENADPHVVSQTKTIEYAFEYKPTRFILRPITDIKSVLEHYGLTYKWLNASKKVVTKEMLTPEQIKQIQFIYRDDYALARKYFSKQN